MLHHSAPAAGFTTMLKTCFQILGFRKQLVFVKNYVVLAYE